MWITIPLRTRALVMRLGRLVLLTRPGILRRIIVFPGCLGDWSGHTATMLFMFI
ncbi:hypothetical protein N878_01555 [Pseudomonas sp. EGD-AK9]|nr:hypothetical protein N878_01555 [Pseudomonas sp. EGD-AK9]